MGDEEANKVLLAIGKMQGTLNGMAGDITSIKTNQSDQYKMIDANRQKITVLETINLQEEKQADRAAPTNSIEEERIALRYIRRHWQGATIGGIGVGGLGGIVLLILWALKAFLTGEIEPLP